MGSHMNNAAYTHTGGRWGEDDLGNYKGYSEYYAPYDESQVWMMNTGRMAPSTAQTNFKQKRYNLNAIDQPTEQYFEYSALIVMVPIVMVTVMFGVKSEGRLTEYNSGV